MRFSLVRIGEPGVVAPEYQWGLHRWYEADKCEETSAGRSLGAVWGSMIISTQAAYTVEEASNQAEGWALLGPVVDSEGEVGFGGVLSSR